jgi:release factor glutamine methyltransferase
LKLNPINNKMYSPAEDSYFLSDIIENELKRNKNKNIKFLDLGCGSCIQSLNANKFIDKENILCADIDKESLEEADNLGFKFIKSDLFSKIKEKFDLISFNAPYLPEDKHDKKKDTTGGKKGDETILKFLKQAKSHLNKSGKIFLLFSSHTPKEKIEKEIKKQKLKIININEKVLFMEKLFVYELE